MPDSQTPSASSVAIVRDNEVLVIQRATEPYKGYWSLPGGRLEQGESAEVAAKRELREELGIEIGDLHVVDQIEMQHGFTLKVFATDRFIGEIVPNQEVSAFEWLSLEQLTSRTCTHRLENVVSAALGIVSSGSSRGVEAE